jgi:hypothetical protein
MSGASARCPHDDFNQRLSCGVALQGRARREVLLKQLPLGGIHLLILIRIMQSKFSGIQSAESEIPLKYVGT